jgi:hypothetical protein
MKSSSDQIRFVSRPRVKKGVDQVLLPKPARNINCDLLGLHRKAGERLATCLEAKPLIITIIFPSFTQVDQTLYIKNANISGQVSSAVSDCGW